MVKDKSSCVAFCVPVIHTLAHGLQEIDGCLSIRNEGLFLSRTRINYDTSIVGLLGVLVCAAQWINSTPGINRTSGINKHLSY